MVIFFCSDKFCVKSTFLIVENLKDFFLNYLNGKVQNTIFNYFILTRYPQKEGKPLSEFVSLFQDSDRQQICGSALNILLFLKFCNFFLIFNIKLPLCILCSLFIQLLFLIVNSFFFLDLYQY